MGGLRPVIALYATFLSRAFDQTNLDVGLHNQPVIFCLDRAGITGEDGPSHHGIYDMALLSKIPNMTILCPSSYQEIQQMLMDAYNLNGPVCIRWPKTAAPSVSDAEVGSGLSGRKVRNGSNVCLIGFGKMLAAAQEAAALLEADGLDATVWDPRAAKPLDPALVSDAATHNIVVTIEDGLASGGVGAMAANELRDAACRVEVLGVPTEYIAQGNADAILAELGLNGEGVARTVRRLIAG